MNLYFRLFLLLIKLIRKPSLGLLDTSVLKLRVLPNDLDINMHMNNGRYLSIMDLGRVDIMHRIGLMEHIITNRWSPVVGHLHMRFRRPFKLFQQYELSSRIVSWDEKWVYIEQTFICNHKIHAVGLVQGLIRGKEGNIPSSQILELLGLNQPPPVLTDDIKVLQQFGTIE